MSNVVLYGRRLCETTYDNFVALGESCAFSGGEHLFHDHFRKHGIGSLARSRQETAASTALQSCMGLNRPNWDGEGASPISEESVSAAHKLLIELLSSGYTLPDIASSPDGSIGMEWWNGKARVFVDVGPEKIVRIYFNPGNGQPYEEESIAWGQPNLTSRVIRQLDRLYPSSNTANLPMAETYGFTPLLLRDASGSTMMGVDTEYTTALLRDSLIHQTELRNSSISFLEDSAPSQAQLPTYELMLNNT